MSKRKSQSQKRRRNARRKIRQDTNPELAAWLNDKSPRKEFNGKSAHDVFRSVGIATVSALRNFLEEPDMQAYLRISALKDGERVQVTLRGVEYVALNNEGRLQITDDVDMFNRIDAAFDRAVPKFKNTGDIKAWIKALPKWGGGEPTGAKRKELTWIDRGIDKKVPVESTTIIPAKTVPTLTGDMRRMVGHTTVDTVISGKVLKTWMDGIRANLPKGVVYGEDFKASTMMVGKDLAKVHWFALTDAGDQWLDAMTGALSNPALAAGTLQIGEIK
jgi:hypothetical protein